MKPFPLCLLSALCLAFLGPLRAQNEGNDEVETARVFPSKDVVIYAEDSFTDTDRANGTGQTLLIGNVQSNFTRRSLIAFELDRVIPPGSLVVNARLILGTLPSSFGGFVAIFRVLSPWAAGVTDPADEIAGGVPQAGDVTWNFRFYNAHDTSGQAFWQQPGGDFDFQQPLLSMAGEEGSGDLLTFTNEALVADVQQMLNQPEQHFGWILLGDESSNFANALQVASSENERESLRPVLEVEHTAPRDVDKMIANYDALVTVAGIGDKGDRHNHWKPRFEGANALEVELSRPSTASAAEDGTIYFTDTYGHAIRKITPEGKVVTLAGTGVEGYNGDSGPALDIQLDQPNGLAVMPNENLYVLDIDNKRVRKVTPDGEMTTVFHDETEPPFLTGRGLWVSPDEETIVYGSRTALKRWTKAGGIEVIVRGFVRLSNIGRDPLTGDFLGADVDDNTVWRIDMENGSRQRIAGDGRFLTSGIDARETRMEGVRGLAVTEHGAYFVTTEDGGDVWYVDPDGIAHVLLIGSGSGDLIGGEGQTLAQLAEHGENIMGQPYAITIAPNGDLVLVTNETGVIRVIRKGAAPRIQGFGFDGEGGFGIQWSSQPRRLYLLEASEDLENWELMGEVPSNSQSTVFIDSAFGANPKRFYWVRFFYP